MNKTAVQEPRVNLIADMDIGKKILQLRKEKGWTQAEMAKVVGTSQRFVSEWELGKNLPSAASLVKLSQILGVSIDYLLLDNVPREGVSSIDDFELYDYFRATESLPAEKKAAIKEVISSIVFAEKVKQAEKEAPKTVTAEMTPKKQKNGDLHLRRVAGKR